MVSNDQSFEFKLEPHALREIEHFADLICDQLFINETYYGNILMSLTEFFQLLIHSQQKGKVKITYNTDYQKVNTNFYPVDPEIVKAFSEEISFDAIADDDALKSAFLISKLVDEIDIVEHDSISLLFDISAMHHEVYEHRKNQLQNYFTRAEEKVKKKDDQL